MALDNAQFIAELSITDPPGSDPLSQGDDQIRTIKRATQQSFPNVDKAVTLTGDQMNAVAIKNEANVFTAAQTIQDNELILNAVADVGTSIEMNRSGLARWTMSFSPDATGNEWVLARFDDLGAFIDRPMEADRVTGIVNFAHVPTVQGDPLWIPGEVKLLVQGATLPSNNWFLCNGTNGTVALQDRILGAQGTFTGTRTPFLDVQTDVGPNVGSTVLSANQMPTHNHRIYTGSEGSGLTDTILRFNSFTGETVVGANRDNLAPLYLDQNNTGVDFIEDTGGGAGHIHSIPELECNPAGSDAFQVMPFSYFFQAIQYVP